MADITPLFRQDPEADTFLAAKDAINPITGRPGANQFILAPKRDDYRPVSDRSNRVQDGQLPRTSGPDIGTPDAVNPLGRRGSASING